MPDLLCSGNGEFGELLLLNKRISREMGLLTDTPLISVKEKKLFIIPV
jgi:hypothetical protein